MINFNEIFCPKCGGNLKYYDSVKRVVRTKMRKTKHIRLRRFRCVECGCIHRELPNYIFPYKQYEKAVILGVVNGYITYETLGYEDYPCEMTMLRWCSEKIHIIS